MSIIIYNWLKDHMKYLFIWKSTKYLVNILVSSRLCCCQSKTGVLFRVSDTIQGCYS